jgi:ferredoxin-NADP reductase/predicted pyridoxine 5'-phosphate oxidase superfamily flavin-nucleotide-binding protein
MHWIKDIEELEAINGKPSKMVFMKQIPMLEEGCVKILAQSPIAGFGYQDEEGNCHTTLVGGEQGFTNVESPIQISFDFTLNNPFPAKGSGVSFVFLLPGVGEVLRLNGILKERVKTKVTISVNEAFIHCAMAVLRSRLWSVSPFNFSLPADNIAKYTAKPLLDSTAAEFLKSSTFIFLSSWDANGSSDTSPRGDDIGFVQILDTETLALPDRKGNKRTDTFRNLLNNNKISLVAIIPGCNIVLQVSGNAKLTNDESLLSKMDIGGKPPVLALVIKVESASFALNENMQKANIWHHKAQTDQKNIPDMMALALKHFAMNEARGIGARIRRYITSTLSKSPALIRLLVNFGYQKDLKAQGYLLNSDDHQAKTNNGFTATLLLKLPIPVRRRISGLLNRFSVYLKHVSSVIDSDSILKPSEKDTLPDYEVQVKEIKKETSTAVTLTLEEISGKIFEFKPGQFFTVLMNINGEQVRRAYSASNAPGTNLLNITVKKVAEGKCSTYITQDIKKGDLLDLFGPSGRFCVTLDPASSREYVLLAAGSGITPMMSIVQTVLAKEPESKVSILHGNRSLEDIIFREDWTIISSQYPERLMVRHLLSSPPPHWDGGIGRLDETDSRNELLRLAPSNHAEFYICGPVPMIKAVKQALLELDISLDRIHEESFNTVQQSLANESYGSNISHNVYIRREGTGIGDFLVPAGKSILQAGLDAHVPMKFSCGMGNCGDCRVKLIRGEVSLSEPNCLTREERDQGFILSCVAKPVTACSIEI